MSLRPTVEGEVAVEDAEEEEGMDQDDCTDLPSETIRTFPWIFLFKEMASL